MNCSPGSTGTIRDQQYVQLCEGAGHFALGDHLTLVPARDAAQVLEQLAAAAPAPTPAPWWHTADNPPCPDWCTTKHEPDEFRTTGAIDHWRTFGEQQHKLPGIAQPIVGRVKRLQTVNAGDEPDTYTVGYDQHDVELEAEGISGWVPLTALTELTRWAESVTRG